MIEIRNLLSQPLTFQLAGEERGLHLGSRQRKLVDDVQVSEEIRTAAKRGFVALTMLEQPDQLEAQPASGEDAAALREAAAEQRLEPVAGESIQAQVEPTTAPEDDSGGAGPETAQQPVETADKPRSTKRR